MNPKCSFCYKEEKGRKHGPEVTDILCSSCVAKLVRMPFSDLEQALEIAKEKNLLDKVFWLERFIGEKQQEVGTYVRKTKKTRGDLDRSRTMRKTRTGIRFQVS